ncbi:MAG: D-cysteine desulfhydrase family protein [Pseudomonas putida]|nr:MAG: D-cysteine desulfhydrase family protein [Pseudomonas putida]
MPVKDTQRDALDALDKVTLIEAATPIQRLQQLELRLGIKRVNLYIKRDDHMAFAGGGNKLRKLELLLGEALAQGCDTIVTTGGLQSNHARLTAAAAARLGLNCELVLGRVVPRQDAEYEHNGNVLLDQIYGAKLHILPPGEKAGEFASRRIQLLSEQGKKPYLIPMGGSSALGALGYAKCSDEIMQYERDHGIRFEKVLLPNGSSGTHAGLAAGFVSRGRSPTIIRSYSVLVDKEQAVQQTLKLANDALALLDISGITPSEIDVDGRHRGEGYGIPTQEALEAITSLAQAEGILLDPVYSAKAFAGMLHDIAAGDFVDGANLLFLFTGGGPGVYAYRSAFVL